MCQNKSGCRPDCQLRGIIHSISPTEKTHVSTAYDPVSVKTLHTNHTGIKKYLTDKSTHKYKRLCFRSKVRNMVQPSVLIGCTHMLCFSWEKVTNLHINNVCCTWLLTSQTHLLYIWQLHLFSFFLIFFSLLLIECNNLLSNCLNWHTFLSHQWWNHPQLFPQTGNYSFVKDYLLIFTKFICAYLK